MDYTQIRVELKKLIEDIERYAMINDCVDSSFYTAKGFLDELLVKSYKCIKTRLEMSNYFKSGSTNTLIQLLMKVGYDDTNLIQFNAMALIDSVKSNK